MRPRLKICGLRRVADACDAVAHGASLLGCVLAPDSPRAATPAEVTAIRESCGHAALVVLVTRGLDLDAVLDLVEATGVRHVQPHCVDAEFEAALGQAGCRVLRVRSIESESDPLPLAPGSPTAPTILDTGRGGTGRAFDWSALGDRAPANTLIAGGITPTNVTRLVRDHRPWGIDVSSGIESAPGIKDIALLRALVRAVDAGQGVHS